ncbi:MAG: peptidoglycan-binding domain-containing protein [Candidatus Aminicenantes bacterium]|jgi:hypothetical protein
MPEERVCSGATTTITLRPNNIRVKEIRFNWGTGSNALQIVNHIVGGDVNPPEWEYDKTRRVLRRQSPIMEGVDVTEVQQILMSLGIDVGPDEDDGRYGRNTKNAVEEFQERHFLGQDGQVGRETRTFLGVQGAAGYSINTQFVIQVKFIAHGDINSAEIWTVDDENGFGGLGSETDPTQPVTVNFNCGESDFYNFMIRTAPTNVSLYETTWLWKCRNINAGGSRSSNIGRTKHLIYIVSDAPVAGAPQGLLLGENAFNSTSEYFSVYAPTIGNLKIELRSGLFELYYRDLSHKLGGPFLSGCMVHPINQVDIGLYLIKVMGTANIEIRCGFFQEGQTSKVPWEGWYWPFVDGEVVGGSRSWCEPNMYDIGGPLDMYDQYTGQTGSASARLDEYNSDRIDDASGDTSGGHCDGTAMAGFEIDEPNSAKTLNGVHFSVENLKGLATERYWIARGSNNAPNGDSSNEFRKGGYYLDAVFFHEKLIERLRSGSNRGFILKQEFQSRRPISGLWNWPVYKFRADFVAEGINDPDKRRINVECELTYRKLRNLRNGKWEHEDYTYTCQYLLEYDNSGNISTGAWDPIDGNKPIAIYYKRRDVDPINPWVDRTIIDSIL